MLILKQNITFPYPAETISFKDITGTTAPDSYSKSGNIGYSDVDAVLFKAAYYPNIAANQTLTSGDTFSQYWEYVKTGGNTSTVDSKAMVIGSTFTPQITGVTVPSGDTWLKTGYYNPNILATWLPTATQVALSLTPQQLGFDSTQETISDGLYQVVYNVYRDAVIGTRAAINGTSYIVMTSTVSYNGNTYRAGETFTATNTTNIAGAGTTAIMDSTSFAYWILTPSMESQLFSLVLSNTNKQEIQDKLYAIRVQLEALSYSAQTQNLSYTITNDLLDYLQSQLTFIESSN